MDNPPDRAAWYRWYVCGLLLLATTIKYMDRQTLSNAAPRVIAEFNLSKEQYGELEAWFGYAFAGGALVFGIIADRVNVRWLYPLVLVAWSLAGMATGWSTTFTQLLLCRTLLGVFESGHWPCALKTTAAILPPKERTMGNSLLQSGTSIGAIITPLIMMLLLTAENSSWRFAFQAIGAIGLVWVLFWFISIRSDDLRHPQLAPTSAAGVAQKAGRTTPDLTPLTLVRRLFVLACVVIMINACWHLFRVWLPLFLREGRGYTEQQTFWCVSGFYAAADVGCIAAGWATVQLHRWGYSVDFSRWLVYVGCSMCAAVSIFAAYMPAGWPLIALLMVVAGGALGLFPCYYALSQEVSAKNQGLVTGMLGTIAWGTSSPMHKFFGRFVDTYQSYDLGLAIVGCLPLAAALIWLAVWDWRPEEEAPIPAVVVEK